MEMAAANNSSVPAGIYGWSELWVHSSIPRKRYSQIQFAVCKLLFFTSFLYVSNHLAFYVFRVNQQFLFFSISIYQIENVQS